MKSMKKLLVTLVLGGVFFCMAMPAFATRATAPTYTPLTVEGHIYSNVAVNLLSVSPNSCCLNLEGNGLAYNHRPVTRASRTTSKDQIWCTATFGDGLVRVTTSQHDANGNTGYALNLLRSTESGGSYSCDIYRITPSDYNAQDSAVVTPGSPSDFSIQLPGYNGLALTVLSNSRNIKWAPYQGSILEGWDSWSHGD